MLYKKLLLLILLLFACLNGFSVVFVVTSNADSGTGTLRDALTQAAANGSAEKDYINFNLADLSEAGRTIIFLTPLPNISPNMVIDGTTQPGAAFGVSGAKVKLIYSLSDSTNINILKGSNIGDLSLSGLWLSTNSLNYSFLSGIAISNSGSITISNCLVQFGNVSINDCQQLTFKNNILGYLPDGKTGWPNSLLVDNTVNNIIGGSSNEGNLISGSIKLSNEHLAVDWIYLISNNLLGTDYTGTSSSVNLCSLDQRISVTTENAGLNYSNLNPMHGVISNNVVANFGPVGIYVAGIGDVSIIGNDVGTDKTGTVNFSKYEIYYVQADYAPTAIMLELGINAIVGGSNPGDGNKIAYTTNAILEQLANQVTITQNSIYCMNTDYYNKHALFGNNSKVLPVVTIVKITSNKVSGTATPNARVELFADNESDCVSCNPRDFFASVNADNQGNWSYTGAIPAELIASAIYNNQTSNFTVPIIDTTKLVLTQPKCGDLSGAIKGIAFYNAGQVRWFDESGKVVSTSLDVNNLPPGKYKLKVGSDNCGKESDWITLLDNRPKIDTSNLKLMYPSCNKNAAISGISATSEQNEKLNYSWVDQNSKQVATTADISNLTPGSYTLTVTGSVNGCSSTYGPVVFKNTPGPNIDQSKQNIQPTNCGQSTGFITNLIVTGTGTLKYIWRDSNQQTVGTDKDLLNQPAGTYKLQVTDDTQCGAIYSTDITIPETNGITIDESKAQTSIAMCGLNNGSITGLKVTGATSYIWTNGANTTTTITPDLLNMPPGDYVLTASNNFGCSKTSKSYHIGQQLATKFPVYASLIMTSCFKGNDGWVEITTDSSVKSLRWVDGQGQNVGTNATLAGVGPGVYQLYLTDQNGCESFYNSYTVREFPEYTVALYGTVTTDKCGLSTGAVSATIITGGVPPYTYKWRDPNNNPLGTASDIANLPAGTYILNVVDTRCGNVDITYAIAEDSENIAAPSVSNVQLCSAGSALLRVNNAQPSVTYRLYDNLVSPHVVDEQKGGSFKVNVTANESFYISQLNGTCESERAEIQVTVGLSAKDIVNTFTPNGDGINDYWKINSMESYPQANIQVFTRNGQLVFNSIGYAHPFDGTFNGKKLAAGVYYYVINLGTSCKILSGSLTVIR